MISRKTFEGSRSRYSFEAGMTAPSNSGQTSELVVRDLAVKAQLEMTLAWVQKDREGGNT